VSIPIPAKIAAACQNDPQRAEWLRRLPDVLAQLERRWSLKIGTPFDGSEVSCSWVAPVAREDQAHAVLKLGMPHFEGEHEIEGLRFWAGDPTVRLLEADDEPAGKGPVAALDHGKQSQFNEPRPRLRFAGDYSERAMLLERCDPGTSLREQPETEQDVIIAGLLRRLWRAPSAPHRFRPLASMTAFWSRETQEQPESWHDPGLVAEGLQLFQKLPETAPAAVLLATDLHAGNVLRARREPWLVIDPKPFVGDPAYDATQHLFNCYDRLRSNPDRTIRRFADLLGLDHERVRLWTFARAAVQSGAGQHNERWLELARAIKI
jgi:streptomycin 6-kinase